MAGELGSLGHSAADVEEMPICYGLAVLRAARAREGRQIEAMLALLPALARMG